jgi:uncharacterized protein YijF (DUF1287 family)
MIGLRLYALAGGIGVLLVLVILLQAAWRDAEKAKARADAAEAREVVAVAQGDLNQSAGEAVAHAQTRELSITLNAERQADAVLAAPGGDVPLSAGVLDSWSASIRALRESTQ